MPKLMLGKILVNGELMRTSSAHVYDPATGESLSSQIASIKSAIDGLSGAEVEGLKTDLAALKTTFDAFMTGEDDDNGALDRLKELVAAIQANKDSIDALTADKALKTDLEALVARVAALEGKNWTILDGLGKSEATGNLTFNGKELTGETGIAIGSTAGGAASYNGRIQIVLEEVEIAETA